MQACGSSEKHTAVLVTKSTRFSKNSQVLIVYIVYYRKRNQSPNVFWNDEISLKKWCQDAKSLHYNRVAQ